MRSLAFLPVSVQSLACGLAAEKAKPETPKPPHMPTTHYEPRQLRGRTIRVHKDLLEEKNKPLLNEVIEEGPCHESPSPRLCQAG